MDQTTERIHDVSYPMPTNEMRSTRSKHMMTLTWMACEFVEYPPDAIVKAIKRAAVVVRRAERPIHVMFNKGFLMKI